jgi:acetyltransferase-like isoleucine patch superfamily enzyme
MAEKKVKDIMKTSLGAKQYQDLVIGRPGLWNLLRYELLTGLLGSFPGALGLFLRKITYPILLRACGAKVIFGRQVVLRHPHKIKIGAKVIIDDSVVIDAKGQDNEGITIEDGVYLGRGSTVYCKGGSIEIGEGANIGHQCIISSTDRLIIGRGALIAAFCYINNGGRYDYQSPVRFVEQSGFSKGPTILGDNCWLGAGVIVNDGVKIGEGAVVGAGAVVVDDVQEYCVAAGVPAKIIKKLK